MSDKRLNKLFDMLVDEMSKMLKDGKTVMDKESGEAIKTSPDAATLNVIRAFLKDQGVSATAEHEGIQKMREALPFKLPDTPDKTDHLQ